MERPGQRERAGQQPPPGRAPAATRPPSKKEAARQNISCNEIDSHLLFDHCLTYGAPPDRQTGQVRRAAARGSNRSWQEQDFRIPPLRHSTPTFVGTAPSRGAFGSSQSSEDRESNQTPLSRSRLPVTSQATFLFRASCRHGAPPGTGAPALVRPWRFSLKSRQAIDAARARRQAGRCPARGAPAACQCLPPCHSRAQTRSISSAPA